MTTVFGESYRRRRKKYRKGGTFNVFGFFLFLPYFIMFFYGVNSDKVFLFKKQQDFKISRGVY